MARLSLALLACLCLVSSASAALSSLHKKNDPTPFGHRLALELKQSAPAVAPSTATSEPELVINDRTEVQVDGRACRYQDVPANAAIVFMEVAVDKKTVLKVYFKASKRR